MTDIAGLCSDEARAIETLKDILSPKSTGTLVKRSGSLWRYAAFLAGRGVTSPFAADEANLYLYLQKLKKEECTSYGIRPFGGDEICPQHVRVP